MSDIRNAGLATIAAVVEKKHPLGRTAVMKFCYFLQTLRRVPLSYRFSLYSYGPFDSSVLSDISSAEALGGIESKTVLYTGGYGYEISPARNCEFVKNLAPEFIRKHGPDLDWVIQQFGEFGSADLELLSTIVYADREIARAETSQPSDMLAKKVHEIKPHFELPYVQSKVKYLDQREFLRSLKATPIPC
jgi:hypothetical protein